MPIKLILAVGREPALLEYRSQILRSAGYIVDSELSLKRAIQRYKYGDFDLVLLCHTIPVQERDRLISSIQAFGSLTPVVTVAPPGSQAPDAADDVTSEGRPEEFLSSIQCALLEATAFHKSLNREWAFFY
jgi:CheY-like chemotaxis protein